MFLDELGYSACCTQKQLVEVVLTAAMTTIATNVAAGYIAVWGVVDRLVKTSYY